MRKLFLLLSALCAITASAALDTYTGSYHASVLNPSMVTNTAVLTTTTGGAVDLLPYKGFGTVCVAIGADAWGATNRTVVVTIQQTNTVSSGWATLHAVTNTAATASFTRVPIEINKGGRYLRAVVTSTNSASAVSISINAISDQ